LPLKLPDVRLLPNLRRDYRSAMEDEKRPGQSADQVVFDRRIEGSRPFCKELQGLLDGITHSLLLGVAI
jgi:hypothetical protein